MAQQLSPDAFAPTLEQLKLRLASLVCERERLRENGSSREALEHNRLAIGRCQCEFSHALIRRYLALPVERAA